MGPAPRRDRRRLAFPTYIDAAADARWARSLTGLAAPRFKWFILSPLHIPSAPGSAEVFHPVSSEMGGAGRCPICPKVVCSSYAAAVASARSSLAPRSRTHRFFEKGALPPRFQDPFQLPGSLQALNMISNFQDPPQPHASRHPILGPKTHRAAPPLRALRESGNSEPRRRSWARLLASAVGPAPFF